MRYQWILFDLDNTLFDYDRAEAAALRRAFEHAGCRFEPDYGEVYRRINDRLWRKFERGEITQVQIRTQRFEQFFAQIGLDLDVHAFSPQYLEYLSQGYYLVDGAEAVVKALYGRAGLMLITNGLKEVQRPRLSSSTLAGYFSDLVVSEEEGASKPNGRIFDVAFARMDHPPKNAVLMVGDSLSSDIQGGYDYGIDTCWFNPQHRPGDAHVPATYEIGNLQELPALLGVEEE